MAFWILNKKNNAPAICGSVKAVHEYTAINISSLYTCFSRKKLKEYENINFRICKIPIMKICKNNYFNETK